MPKTNIALENLRGFIKKGARATSKGWIPTGHFELDFAIKYGKMPTDANDSDSYDPTQTLGLPLGRIVEIFGAEAGGKSSLAYRVCGYAQKAGEIAAWIDTEHSFEEELAELNGCNVDELLYSNLYDEDNPDKSFFAEEIMDMMVELCKAGVRVIVLDSIANLISKETDEKQAGEGSLNQIARLLSRQLGKVAHYAAKNNVLVICINQLREKPNVQWGSPETTPGGRALKHNASVRVKITKSTSQEAVIFMDDGEIIGRYSNVSLEKNRMGPPLLDHKGKSITIRVPIYYKPYFPNLAERLFDSGRQLKVISVRKGIFSWKDMKVEGRDDFISQIETDKLEKDLFKDLQERAKEDGVILPPEVMRVAASLNGKEYAKPDEPKTERVSRTRAGKNSKLGNTNDQKS